MQRFLTNVGVALAVIVVAGVAAFVGWDLGRPATHHAASPTTTLRQAAVAMESVASYRFSGHLTIGVEVLTLSGEFSTPDNLHETLVLGGAAPVERIVVGQVTYQKGPFGWAKVASATTASDPRSTFGALALATHVTQSGSVYSFSMTGPPAAALVTGVGPDSTVTGTVTLQAGQIVSITYSAPVGAGTTVTFIYSGIGTTPPVTAPAGV